MSTSKQLDSGRKTKLFIRLTSEINGNRTAKAVLTRSRDVELGHALVGEAVADVAEEVAAFGFGT